MLQQFRNLAIRRLGQSQSTQIFKRKKGNPNLTPKYCWKRDNPDSEDFFLAKCAAVNYRRAQHVKEYIYEEDIKEGLWRESDQMFLRVLMKLDRFRM